MLVSGKQVVQTWPPERGTLTLGARAVSDALFQQGTGYI